MRVVHVSSEVFPFSRSGGLGDVLGALPAVQAKLGAQVTVVSPWYSSLASVAGAARVAGGVKGGGGAGEPREVWRGTLPELRFGPVPVPLVRVGEVVDGGVQFVFIGLPEFDRPGLYHADDVWRFSLFGRTVMPVLRQLGLRADVLHGHDWQAGLAVAYAHLLGVKTVFTVHNLQYQGRWNLEEGSVWTGLPVWAFGPETLEFHGDVNLMKAGLVFADHVTTVSPTYAREITTRQYGEGLDGLLFRLTLEGRVSGIINGLDQERWNPSSDPEIVPFRDAASKAGATAALREEFGFDQAPILGVVSRLADQKGMDLLIEAMPELIKDWNVVVLGGGDALLTAALTGWAQHPRVAFVSGMNEALAHRIYAGADVFAMPSRFEPCGLSQMISMRYGTLPIVRETGGLVDTVPHEVGFHFVQAAPEALVAACQQARQAYENKADWQARITRAMSLDFDWTGPAKQYLDLYGRL